jgi:hypothetical protein
MAEAIYLVAQEQWWVCVSERERERERERELVEEK